MPVITEPDSKSFRKIFFRAIKRDLMNLAGLLPEILRDIFDLTCDNGRKNTVPE
jgi:hypothetical protein